MKAVNVYRLLWRLYLKSVPPLDLWMSWNEP